MSQSREKRLRRALGLGPAPDPVGVRLDSGRLQVVPAGERAAAFEAWHREGARARLAESVAYLPQRVEHGVHGIRGRAVGAVGERALARARTLTYRSRHLHPIGETRDIEGYFDLGRARYRLDILSAGILAETAELDWTAGRITRNDENPWSGAECVLVPGDSLDDAVVADAIARWYSGRYRWRRGHWSQLEGRLPTIEVDLAWSPPDRL